MLRKVDKCKMFHDERVNFQLRTLSFLALNLFSNLLTYAVQRSISAYYFFRSSEHMYFRILGKIG